MMAYTMGRAFQQIVVGISFAGAGFALYLALSVNFREFRETRDWYALAYAVNRASVATVLLLITEAVYKAPTLPWTWRLGLYTLALIAATVSWIFIAKDHRRRNRRRTDREG